MTKQSAYFEHAEVFERSNQTATSRVINSCCTGTTCQFTSQKKFRLSSGMRVSGDKPSTLQSRLGTKRLFCSDVRRNILCGSQFSSNTYSRRCLIIAGKTRSKHLPCRNIIIHSKLQQMHKRLGRLYLKIIKYQKRWPMPNVMVACRIQVAPSVQRRKVWLTPITRCRAVTLPRRQTS